MSSILLLIILFVISIATIIILDGGPLIFLLFVLLILDVPYMKSQYRKIKLMFVQKQWKKVMKLETINFQNLCEELCNNVSRELKQKRRKYNIRKFIFICGLVLPWFLLFYLLLEEIYVEYTASIFMISYIILIVCLCSYIQKYPKEIYTFLYKDEVISKFLKIINNKVEYNKNELVFGKIKENYNNLKFENTENINWKMDVEDCIYGYLNKNNYFQMSDVVSYFKQRKSKDIVLFKGNFVSIDTNLEIEEIRILLKNNNSLNINNLIKINNTNFNKYFEVHSYSKEKVHEFLSPSLIDFLADFREKYKIDFEIIFKDKIYIRFYTFDMFEPKMFGKIVDMYSIYQYYVITKFANELVEKLDIDNLN